MLDAPVRGRATGPGFDGGRRLPGGPSERRDPVADLREDYGPRRSKGRTGPGRRAPELDEESETALEARRARGLRLRLQGKVPTTTAARVGAGVLVLAGLGGLAFGLSAARAALLHDARLLIPSSHAVEITGNNHLSRPQLLSVFGGDVDRNLLSLPLEARRAELEALPWVEHATVMRLLPNRVQVAIVERTPVAFVRQGNEIGLVDAHGVLLDLAPDSDHGFSFPVVTGISAGDPPSTRAARMRVYQAFTRELDAGGDAVSKRLSEVDLSDPDDVKALLPDDGVDVLLHFGDRDYLDRYHRYLANLPDWKTKYPRLSSVDLRYEHEVVLEMAPGVVVSADPAAAKPAVQASKPAVPAAPGAVRKVPVKVVAKAKPWKAAVVHPAAGKAVASKVAVSKAAVAKPAWKPKPGAWHPVHLQKSFDVHPKAGSR